MKTIRSTWQLMKMGLEIGVWWEKPEGVLISHLGGLRFKGCGSGMCLCHKLLFHVYVAAHEPVWVWTPNLLTIAVSPETPLYTFLPFSPFHLVLCVCTYVCLCLHFSKQPIKSPCSVSHTAALFHLLSLSKQSSHLFSMKRGIKPESQAATDHFHPALL